MSVKKEGITGIFRMDHFPPHRHCATSSKGITSLTSEVGSMQLTPAQSVLQPLLSTTAMMRARLLIQ